MSNVTNPTVIFREYIGVKEYPTNFSFPTQLINNKIPEFHFILGMATEEYDGDGKGTGIFRRTCDYNHFGAEQVKFLKEEHPKVKVVISIGGRGPEFPFNPSSKDKWIFHAIKTIKDIIADYTDESFNTSCGCDVIIVGIDINYEYIGESSSPADFSLCIGKVITSLKDVFPSIHFVSIAPSKTSLPHYTRLYMECREEIHLVDYQFYDENVTTIDAFIELYGALSKDFGIKKLLVGYSTDRKDTHCEMKEEVFIEGAKHS